MTTGGPRESSSPITVVTWLLLAVACALAVLIAMQRRASSRPEGYALDPLTLVPPGARLVVSLDVASLSRDAMADLARLGGDKLLGLQDTCGFEPLLAIERAALALPSEETAGGSSDFALIAVTQLEVEQGLRCAELVIGGRGGKPSRTRFGTFTSVRDLSRPAGEVALRPDGMFVLSGGRYFRDVMDAAAGAGAAEPAASLRMQMHASLRRHLGTSQLQVTFVPQPSALLPGVLAAGIGLEMGPQLSVSGLVACASIDACATARELLDGAKHELAQEPGLSGLAGVRVAQRGDRLEIAGRLPREQLRPLLPQLLAP